MTRRERIDSVAPRVALAVLLVIVARTVQQQGHAWGDDFALYVNQARGLLDGTAAQVVADNRYAMDNSAFPSFTPIAYPWGTSLLLLPFVAIGGLDYALLKWVPTLGFVVAALCFGRLAERRFGWLAAGALTLMVALNPWYVWATDAVLSDLPFMAAAFGVIVLLDRGVERGSLIVGRHPDAIWVGVLVAAAFHVRREGVGLLAAVAAAQLASLRARPVDRHLDLTHVDRRTGERADAPVAGAVSGAWWRRLGVPWATFAVVGGMVHLWFPAPVRGNVDVAGEPGSSQIRPNLVWYREPFAELAGLKRVGDHPIEAFGFEAFGAALVTLLLGAAVVGAGAAVMALVRRRPTIDLHLAGAVLGMGLIVMMTPYHYQRYLYTLVPLVVLLAARGVTSLAPHERGTSGAARRALGAQIAVVLLLLPSMVHMVRQTSNSLSFHSQHQYVLRGPDDEPTRELWDAVVRYTDGRDVIVFFQARAMNLYTRRLAIVGNDERMMVERGDWFAMERGSDYLQTPLTAERAAELGFVSVWENERYVLWDIPPRPRPWRDTGVPLRSLDD